MLQHRKVAGIIPQDTGREFVGFPGSVVQVALHNELVQKLEAAQENLERHLSEDLYRAQGTCAGLRAALEILHSRDSRDIKQTIFGYDV